MFLVPNKSPCSNPHLNFFKDLLRFDDSRTIVRDVELLLVHTVVTKYKYLKTININIFFNKLSSNTSFFLQNLKIQKNRYIWNKSSDQKID